MALRQEIFIVEQDCPYLDADGVDMEAWHLLLVNASGRLVAYARLIPADVLFAAKPSIGRVVVAADRRRESIGRQLMQIAIRELANLFGNLPIQIAAQSYLEGFYQSLGFHPSGESYLEDGIRHTPMLKPAETRSTDPA